MAAQETRIDKISIFHKISKKHAGTLEITEIKISTGSVLTRWSWLGGPQGPDSGECVWNWNEHKDDPSLALFSLSFRRSRLLQNSAWIGVNRPPARPWFRSLDRIELVDHEFKEPDGIRKNFVWDCKLMLAAMA
ncbi:MAG: hypothetical protein AB7O88_03070 [Reyranellaceae bacterium]